jgi:hypothetical protein
MTTFRKYVLVVLAICSVAIAAYLLRNLFRTDRQLIEEMIEDMRTAVEEKDAGEFLDHLDKAYTDSYGHSFEDVKGILFYVFQKKRKLQVELREVEIALEKGSSTATVMFRAYVYGGSGGQLLFPRKEDTKIQLSVEKKDGEWRVTSATFLREDLEDLETFDEPSL